MGAQQEHAPPDLAAQEDGGIKAAPPTAPPHNLAAQEKGGTPDAAADAWGSVYCYADEIEHVVDAVCATPRSTSAFLYTVRNSEIACSRNAFYDFVLKLRADERINACCRFYLTPKHAHFGRLKIVHDVVQNRRVDNYHFRIERELIHDAEFLGGERAPLPAAIVRRCFALTLLALAVVTLAVGGFAFFACGASEARCASADAPLVNAPLSAEPWRIVADAGAAFACALERCGGGGWPCALAPLAWPALALLCLLAAPALAIRIAVHAMRLEKRARRDRHEENLWWAERRLEQLHGA